MKTQIHILIAAHGNTSALTLTLNSLLDPLSSVLSVRVCGEYQDAMLTEWHGASSISVAAGPERWWQVLADDLPENGWVMVLNEGDVLIPGALERLQRFTQLQPEAEVLGWQEGYYQPATQSIAFVPDMVWAPVKPTTAGPVLVRSAAVKATALRRMHGQWQLSVKSGIWSLDMVEQWSAAFPMVQVCSQSLPDVPGLVHVSLAGTGLQDALQAARQLARLFPLHVRHQLALKLDDCRTYTQYAQTGYGKMDQVLGQLRTLFDGRMAGMLDDPSALLTTLELEAAALRVLPGWLAMLRAFCKTNLMGHATGQQLAALLASWETGPEVLQPTFRRQPVLPVSQSAQQGARRLRMGFLSSDEPDWACPRLRVIDPFSMLAPWVDMQMFPGNFIWGSSVESTDIQTFAQWADVFVIQRAALGQRYAKELQLLFDSGKPVIFETDDMLSSLPVGHSDTMNYSASELARSWERLLPRCSAVVASTESLAVQFNKWNDHVCVIPNCLPPSRWQALSLPDKTPGVVTIGFAGSNTHAEDLRMIGEALWQVRDMLGEDQIHLVFWGAAPPAIFEGANNVRILFKHVDYVDYLAELASLKLDIGIAPMHESSFNACKSDLKWLEYTAVGAATVASDVMAFREPRELGLAEVVGNDVASWTAALLRLIKDAQYRQTLVQRSRDYLVQQADMAFQAGHWVNVLRSVLPSWQLSLLADFALDKVAAPRSTHLYYGSSLKSLQWNHWQKNHSLREIDAEMMAERMVMAWPNQPRFTLIMPVRREQAGQLLDTIASLQSQMYPHWRLQIMADWPQPDPIFSQTPSLAWQQVAGLENEAALVQSVNNVLADQPTDWVMWLKPGTRLEPQALLRFGDTVHSRPGILAVYSDHDHFIHAGHETDPKLKPDFCLDYLRAYDYIDSTVAFAYPGLVAVGGFEAVGGAENWNHFLKLAENFGLACVAHLDEVLLHLPAEQFANDERGLARRQAAMERHLQRLDIAATVQPGYVENTLFIDYAVTGTPLVSIIIPTRDKLEYLRPCIDSLFEKTGYPHFEIIIVDNRSVDPDTHEYYRNLQVEHPGQVYILPYDAPFNFSAQCNRGVEAARGQYILLLNNDTEALHDSWLARLVGIAQRPEVGAVGARLIYPESGQIQHAGIVLGMPGGPLSVADHVFGKSDMNDPRYMNRLLTEQNYSAVTAACLMVSKEKYLAVGGMDETRLTVLFNDVDFCLKQQQQGLLNVYTPYVTLAHHHAKSIGKLTFDPTVALDAASREQKELAVILERWLPQLAHDPAYNRHLSLQKGDMSLELDRMVGWSPAVGNRGKVLGLPIAGGSGEYRVNLPFYALQEAGRMETWLISPKKGNNILHPSIVELKRMAPDALLVHSVLREHMQYHLQQYRRFMPEMEIIFGLDDLVGALPEKSILSKVWRKTMPDARFNLRKVLSLADRLIVSTEPLADVCHGMIDDIRIVPNRLPRRMWDGLRSERGVSKKPRVGWVGAMQHQGDLALITEVVKQTASEVDWIFMGMCLPEIRPYIAEEYTCVSFMEYPAMMARLNLDLAVAPLEENPFNDAKSNLRLLEYGALAWPVVCSDVFPYRTNHAPVCRVSNDPQQWIKAIRERIHDLDATYREGDALRSWVDQHYWLEDHLDDWQQALTGKSAKKISSRS